MEKYLDVNEIIKVMGKKNYKVFKSPKGHDLNLVGIRTKDMTANKFNDWFNVFYLFDGNWNFFSFPATTDPGTYWRKKTKVKKGVAIVKPGQYRGLWKVGKHKGYKALQQVKPITVYRDANRDDKLDVDESNIETDTANKLFMINGHRASRIKASTQVDDWSAGCQVLQDPDHFAFLMQLCERGKEKFGNSFTYTLLTEEDFS